MLPIFTKPIDRITPDDVRELVDAKFPEGSTVEFKQELPHKNNKKREHPWPAGGDITDYSRNALLAELVAFANAHGGTLVLGISESREKPSRADEIKPIPRCGELADRLIDQIRSCIEPKLPIISVKSVPTDDDGNGVVIVRVRQSRSRPHRLVADRQCYYRRADRSEAMTMREIQDLTLVADRGLREIDREFDDRRKRFENWIEEPVKSKNTSEAFGVLVVAIPTTGDINVDRVYQKPDLVPPIRDFGGSIGESKIKITIPRTPMHERPILRGMRRENGTGRLNTYQEVHCNGIVEFGLQRLREDDKPYGIFIEWVFGILANSLATIDKFRYAAGAPDIEYALELEVFGSPKIPPLLNFRCSRIGECKPLGEFASNPNIFPRYSVGSRAEFDDLIGVMFTDIYDAVGVDGGGDPKLTIDFS